MHCECKNQVQQVVCLLRNIPTYPKGSIMQDNQNPNTQPNKQPNQPGQQPGTDKQNSPDTNKPAQPESERNQPSRQQEATKPR
jgi:hypothetical protein